MDLNRDGIDDADQLERCLGARVWGFLKCCYRTTCDAVRGLKTLFIGIATTILGFADELGGVDLQGWASKLFSEEQAMRVGKWLALAGFLMVILRLVTKTPVGKGANVDNPDEES